MIPRNPNGKLEVISYKKIINILKALDGGVDPKDENMRSLVKFLTDGVGLGNMVFGEIPSTARISLAQGSLAVNPNAGKQVNLSV